MKKLITISGPSGVGKSTLATLISYLQGEKSTTIISGDSFHLWPRHSVNWKKYTHLNPKANNLYQAFDIISTLKNGENTSLKKYNHSTGKFDRKQVIEISNDIIIYEGLHALCGKGICDLSDLKIYVDTPESLTKEWKIARDVSSRGYTADEVESELRRRHDDYKNYIEPQKENADIIVQFEKGHDGEIKLKITKGELTGLKEIFDAFGDSLKISKELSSDISLVQGAGGNFSVKVQGSDSFFVKGSGVSITNVDGGNGIVLCSKKNISQSNSESSYNDNLSNSVLKGDGRPSMETGFHASLNGRVVIHTHPVYLNAILCSTESERIIAELFDTGDGFGYDYEYLRYVTPGYKLHKELLWGDNNIVFLENHGLIVSSESVSHAVTTIKWINDECQKWLIKNRLSIISHAKPAQGYLFPDAVVFPNELKFVNDFILSLITQSGLHPRFLTDEQQKEVASLQSEKYRKSL